MLLDSNAISLKDEEILKLRQKIQRLENIELKNNISNEFIKTRKEKIEEKDKKLFVSYESDSLIDDQEIRENQENCKACQIF